MIIAGADVSGFDDERGQHKVISIIIGSEEAINELHNRIGISEIHMRDLGRSKRDLVKKRLVFKHKDILALSLIVGKNRIVHSIHEIRKTEEVQPSIGAIFNYFDHLLLKKINPIAENFLARHGLRMNDLSFQTDSDMKDTLLNWKLQHTSEGKAHQLADALAFFCKRCDNISGCVKRDFEYELEKQMNQDQL